MYHDEYPYGHFSDQSDVTNVNSRFGPKYDKHGKEVLELGSYYDLEPSKLTLHTEEEDDKDAKLATLDQKLMVHSLRIMTLENAKRNEERMEESESKHLPQSTDLGNKGKPDLFDEWMNSIERLDAFVTDNPIDMEVEEEAIDYMDADPTVLMLREERVYWEPPVIVEAMIELKNWAQEGAAHPMEDSVRKIQTIKLVTFAKKIKTVELVTPAKNVVSVPIEYISTSVSILVKSVCDSFPVKSVKNSFPLNMISDSTYLLALNVFISEIGKEILNNKELKHGYLEPIKEETQPINLGTDDDPKMIQVGNTLIASKKDALVALLTEFKEVFAWSYEDMPGIDTNIVQHCIPTDPTLKPDKQQLRRMKPEWTLKIKEEVEKQYNAGFLRVVNYPEWLASLVLVPKKDGKV